MTDSTLLNLLEKGVKDGVFPGGATAVSQGMGNDRCSWSAVAGIKDSRYIVETVSKITLFDLASLSKPLCTTLILYSLIEEGKLSLDDKLQCFFEKELPSDKQSITIACLLSHSSGLADYIPFFKQFQSPDYDTISKNNREILIKFILDSPLKYKSGTGCFYSDLGFILLGYIIERVTGRDLMTCFQEMVSTPLALEEAVFFNPILGENRYKNRFAATEACPWRKKIIRSEVHDEHCWLMNGVSGHAGLFGTVEGVVTLCDAILDQWHGREHKDSKPLAWTGMLKRGLERRYSYQTWCLGFDTPARHGSSGGQYLSPDSVGHLGYSGTSFWIDPHREMVVVLLTNRVHPDRENTKIRQFRPWFHDRVVEIMNI